MENTLNFERLLSSREFTNQVNQIANFFRVGYNEDLKSDVRQVCAIAAWEAFQKYDEKKTNGNFWGYAYLRMREYAKREIFMQRNIVHIPLNHMAENAKYEQVAHTYDGFTFLDGHENTNVVDNSTSDVSLKIDIESALTILDDETRYIFEVHAELKEGKNGKNDFGSLSKELGIPAYIIRKRFIEAKAQIAEYLK